MAPRTEEPRDSAEERFRWRNMAEHTRPETVRRRARGRLHPPGVPTLAGILGSRREAVIG
jgi:hypothetical protein